MIYFALTPKHLEGQSLAYECKSLFNSKCFMDDFLPNYFREGILFVMLPLQFKFRSLNLFWILHRVPKTKRSLPSLVSTLFWIFEKPWKLSFLLELQVWHVLLRCSHQNLNLEEQMIFIYCNVLHFNLHLW